MKFFKSFAVVNICLLFFVLFLAYFVQPPDIVSGCEAKAEETTATITWPASSQPSLYFIYRSEDGDPFMYVGASSTSEFKDTKLLPGTVYTYKVKACNGRRTSAMSEASKIVTGLPVPDISVDVSTGKILLEVTPVDGAETYAFFRDGKEIGRSTDTFCDEEAALDKDYEYSVKAVKGEILSDMSPTVKSSLKSPGEIVTKLDGDDIVVSWSGNKAYTSYKLYDVPDGKSLGEDTLISDTKECETKISSANGVHHFRLTGIAEETVSPTVALDIEVLDEPLSSEEAAMNAVNWAIDIANDDSFNYGQKGSNGPGYANRCGCYFCGTNDKKVKLSGDERYYKTWPCMPFITAAYAHGAKDPEVLKTCQSCHTLETNDNNWKNYDCFEFVGRMSDLTVDDLKPGDVLVHYDDHNGSSKRGGHMSMYAGNGNIVDSSGGGWSADSISLKEGRASSYLKATWNQTPSKNYVMRYVGHGSGTRKVINEL